MDQSRSSRSGSSLVSPSMPAKVSKIPASPARITVSSGSGRGIRLVLMRTVAVHLQLEDDAVGRRGGVVGLVGVVEGKVVGSWRVSVGCGRALRGLTAHPGRAPGAAAPKAGAKRRTAQPLRPRPGGGGVAALAGRGRGLSGGTRHDRRPSATPAAAAASPAAGRSSGRQMETGILRDELVAQPCRETGRAETAQILVEVAELRTKHQGDDARPRLHAAAETLDAVPAGGVRVGRDVEATRSQAGRSRPAR